MVQVLVESNPVAEWMTAIGTVLAVVAALFGPPLLRWYYRPQLSIEFESEGPFVRMALLEGGEVAWWYRVRIRNVGRGTAHRCRARVLEVRDTAGKVRADKDPMTLRWSGLPQAIEFEPLDIVPDDHELADLLCEPSTPYVSPSFVTHPIAAGFSKALESGRTHFLVLSVTSDEVHARACLEVFVSPVGEVIARMNECGKYPRGLEERWRAEKELAMDEEGTEEVRDTQPRAPEAKVTDPKP